MGARDPDRAPYRLAPENAVAAEYCIHAARDERVGLRTAAATHYNGHRPHRSFNQRPPDRRAFVAETTCTRVRRRLVPGVPMNEYSRPDWPSRAFEPDTDGATASGHQPER